MAMCNNCKSGRIKTRRNYTHGKRSRPVVTAVCKKCGSTDIQLGEPDRRRRGFRKR